MGNQLFSWRITKYNPKNRDERGYYLEDKEWTCFSEVGTEVSEEDYLRTESNYINAITTFMDEMGLNKLYLNALDVWSDEVKNQNASRLLSKMWVGKCVTTQEIKELAKLTLRNVIWCKLNYKNDFLFILDMIIICTLVQIRIVITPVKKLKLLDYTSRNLILLI